MDFYSQFDQWEKFDLWNKVFMILKHETVTMLSNTKSDIGRLPSNLNLNRYEDVIPFDHTRVSLHGDKYINASFIQTPIERSKYILTQGPLSSTCSDFWSMIWMYNIPIIVMLCNLVEDGINKCEKYWPCYLSEVLVFENYEINLISIEENDFFTLSHLKLIDKKINQSKILYHFHYNEWPDFGIPSRIHNFVDFICKVQESEKIVNVDRLPTCVHCSAGIGRSGTYILIDTITKQIQQEKSTSNIDVLSTLLLMRSFRTNLINTVDQLKFSYLSIRYYLENICQYKEIPKSTSIEDVLYTSNESDNIEQTITSNYPFRDVLNAVSSIGSIKEVSIKEETQIFHTKLYSISKIENCVLNQKDDANNMTLNSEELNKYNKELHSD